MPSDRYYDEPPSPIPTSIADRLRTIAAREVSEFGDELALWFATSIETRLRSRDANCTLDSALGLQSRRDEARRIIIRAWLALPAPRKSNLASAKAIHSSFQKYQQSNFRKNQRDGTCPDPTSLRGIAHEFLSRCGPTPSVETLRKMLK